MKGLKKLVLATAVAAAPFAQAEMTAMNDALLGEMTGQSGVSIELSAQMSIGSFTYTDGDGYKGSAAPLTGTESAGSFTMSTIALGGNGSEIMEADGVTGTGVFRTALDDIKIDIDVDGDQGLIIHLGGTNSGDVLSGGAQAVDFGLSVGSADVNGAVLASDINIEGFLGPIDVIIANDSTINVSAYFEVTNGSMDIDVLGLGISNLTIGDDSAPILSRTYQTKIEDVQDYAEANLDAGTQTAIEASPTYTAVKQQYLDGGADDATASAAALSTLVRGGAVAGVSNMAYVGMTITTGQAGYGSLVGGVKQANVVDNALVISIDNMNMDIAADLTMGTTTVLDAVDLAAGTVTVLAAPAAASLGSIAINDLDLSGTTLKIYGH